MNFSNIVRTHWAALRALLVLTAIVGIAYPLFIWLVAQLPGLRDNANGSIIESDGKPFGSKLIGQSFTDSNGNPLRQYFQSRPSAAGNGYDPLATSASNLGPESVVDTAGNPSLPKDDNGYKLMIGCVDILKIKDENAWELKDKSRNEIRPQGAIDRIVDELFGEKAPPAPKPKPTPK